MARRKLIDNGGERVERPDEGWFTAADSARALGMTQRGLRSQIMPRLPDGAIQREGRGKHTWLYLPELIQLLIKQRVDKAMAAAEPDPLLRGGGAEIDEGLRRYRLAAADIKEMDAAERRRQLLRVEEVRKLLDGYAAQLKQGLDTLERRWPAAHKVVSRALDEADKTLDRLAEEDAGDQGLETGKP